MRNFIWIWILLIVSCYLSSFFETKNQQGTAEFVQVEDTTMERSIRPKKSLDNTLKVTFRPIGQSEFDNSALKSSIGFEMTEDGLAQNIDGIMYLKIARKWQPMPMFQQVADSADNRAGRLPMYLGYGKGLGKYLIASNGKGFTKYYLVDTNTAEVVDVSAEPTLYKTKDMFISLPATTNLKNAKEGIQLWRIPKTMESSRMEKFMVGNNHYWIPLEAYWESTKSVVIRAINEYDFERLQESPSDITSSFFRMSVKAPKKIV